MVRPTLYVALRNHGLLASAFTASNFQSASTTASFVLRRPKQQHFIFPPNNMTLPLRLSRAQSHQRHSAENDLLRPRASIRDLQQLIDTSLNSYSAPVVPARLLSLINQCAILEDQSNLSNEMYESVVQDMTSFMSSTIASFGKSFESEGVYNPELLNMCEFRLDFSCCSCR